MQKALPIKYNINTLKCQFCAALRSGEMENLMKRKFVQIAALCLALVLLTPCGTASAAQPAEQSSGLENRIIRVGLYYASDVMDGANLLNSVGSGYRLGYFDGENQFVQLGSTEEKAISVVETQNVGYGAYDGYNGYHMELAGSAKVTVGCYHLELPGTYAGFAGAQAAASAYEGGFPACIGGVFYARVGNYTTRAQAVAAQEALAAQGVETALRGTSEYGVSVVITGTSTIIFQYDDLGKGTGVGVMPNQTDEGGDYVTIFHDNSWRGGFRYERVNGGDLTVVNMIKLDDYVKGVVPHEMSNSWPIEALKAQAVAARSYALSLGSKHSSYHFDICPETHCQAYSGLKRAGANSDAAVDQTMGQVAVYNGRIAQTSYYSSNGGASESSSTVWGGNQANYPYLVGKADPYEASAPIPSYSYTRSYTAAELANILNARGNAVGDEVVYAKVSSYTASGNPAGVTFTGSNGKSYTLTARQMVSVFGLRSYRYEVFDGSIGDETVVVNGTAVSPSGLYAIDGSGNITAVGGDAYVITGSGTAQLQPQGGGGGGTSSVITFSGKGWGHNVGMSQWGAYAMAQQGHTYLEILQFYYTGITVGYM